MYMKLREKFMRSRNTSDVTYLYYDTEADAISEIFRVSASSIMNEYAAGKWK